MLAQDALCTSVFSAHRTQGRICAEADERRPSAIKEAAQYLKLDNMLTLGGGLPSSDYFPFADFGFKAPAVGHFSEEETLKSGTVLDAGKHDMAEGKSFYDIATAFNYGQGSGSVQLLRFLIEHTVSGHPHPFVQERGVSDSLQGNRP